jgi:DNA-binding SARP family transcriptional activator
MMRLYAAGVLWLDSSEKRASANLRSSLWRLHRLGLHLVKVSSTHLWLAPEVAVDYRESIALARRLLRQGIQEELSHLEILLSSDLLPDWYDEWLIPKREQLRHLRLHALECVCESLIATGRSDQAVEFGLLAVEGEPLRESAHRVLIEAHLAEGNRGEALRQYRRYRRLLRDGLGVEPSPTVRDLVERIRSDDLGAAFASAEPKEDAAEWTDQTALPSKRRGNRGRLG